MARTWSMGEKLMVGEKPVINKSVRESKRVSESVAECGTPEMERK